MLEIKGPNVMKGYLKQPERTDEKLNDGWYETGDMASIDADGFITITGRLARFSKIAGEMVPHGRVEEELHRLLGLSEQRLSVMGVPDEKRGERLLVLHTLDDNELEELKGKLSEAEIPNLWLPKLSDFQRIDEIPVLGTGKLDIKALKREAEAAAAASPDDEQQ
jgi:acyl-[acyl-carrier-protein]-phospholipid O-acyltransferase/long-chain-fatty-acid--[acyl-carrier-protein] ligase